MRIQNWLSRTAVECGTAVRYARTPASGRRYPARVRVSVGGGRLALVWLVTCSSGSPPRPRRGSGGRSPRRPPPRRAPGRRSARGDHALVVAPTGSGKTLAAFLWALDRLASEPPPAEPQQRCRVLYVSPMKALAVDVERNLRAPLTGIRPRRRPARAAGARHHGRGPLRRHPGRRAPGLPPHPARRPDHDAGVAVPPAHLARPRGAGRRRDGDRRRGARRGRHQARRAPGADPGAARRRCSTGRPSGSGCRRRCGRSTRWPASWPAAGRSTVVQPPSDKECRPRGRRARARPGELGEPTGDLSGPAAGRAARGPRSGRTSRSGSST